MFLSRWKLGPKIYLVVALLALLTALIGVLGIDAMHTYNDKVYAIDRASARAIVGERVNGLIYAVVMDSRGIYMSDPGRIGKIRTSHFAESAAYRGADEAMDRAHRNRGNSGDGTRQRAGR